MCFKSLFSWDLAQIAWQGSVTHLGNPGMELRPEFVGAVSAAQMPIASPSAGSDGWRGNQPAGLVGI